jgi:hypothetical protein
MRMPRMTTRRWMVAVAALAVALGGYREATRLKRNRDEFLARAAGHVAEAAYYRRLVASSQPSVLHDKMVAREWAAMESMSPARSDTEFNRTLELAFGLPEFHSTQADEDDHVRFREAQARAGPMAERGRILRANHLQRELEYHQRRAEYHAAVGRKYRAAASRPWLRIAPDPPKPK